MPGLLIGRQDQIDHKVKEGRRVVLVVKEDLALNVFAIRYYGLGLRDVFQESLKVGGIHLI